jgi:tetratricopeptide (TPR) repeat protein
LELKVHKLKLDMDVKEDEFIRFDGHYWIVMDTETDLEFFRTKGVLLSDDIPVSKLIELVNEWKDVAEVEQNLEWTNRGIFLNSKLLQHDPTSETHKYNLALALFNNAIHWKRDTTTRPRAKELFKEVILINHDSTLTALCHYYIGFIYQYDMEFDKAVSHFEKAIEIVGLDYFQLQRAYCNLGICYSQMGKFDRALYYIKTAKEADVDSRATPEIQMAQLQIEATMDKLKPFMLITKEQVKRISKDEAEEVAVMHDEDGYVLLDWRSSIAYFCGPENTESLNTHAELLRIIMESEGPLTREDIVDKLEGDNFGERSLTPAMVGAYISRLRATLGRCFPAGHESVIQTVKLSNGRNGYVWASSYPYQMILPVHQHITS